MNDLRAILMCYLQISSTVVAHVRVDVSGCVRTRGQSTPAPFSGPGGSKKRPPAVGMLSQGARARLDIMPIIARSRSG
jgi:hypothetical protein